MNLQEAGAKWARKTANAGAKWEAAVRGADYCGGMARFLGVTPNSMCTNWRAGVASVSGGQFQADINGKEPKYIEGMRRAAAL